MDEARHDFHELRLASSVYDVGHLQLEVVRHYRTG